MAETKNIMIVGVGGQGTLLTSRILGGITVKPDMMLSSQKFMEWHSVAVALLLMYVMAKK